MTRNAVIIGAIIVGMTAFPAIARSKPKAPFSNPDNVSRQQNQHAIDAVEEQKAAGEALASSLNGLWDNLITDTGSFFPSLIKGLSGLHTVGFSMWTFWFLAKVGNSRSQPIPWKDAARPFLVFLLLANGGQNLVLVSKGARTIIYSVNDAVLTSTINGIEGRAAIQAATLQEAYERGLKQKVATCKTKFEGDERKICIKEARAQLEELIQKAEGTPQNALEGFGAAISGAFQSLFIAGLASVSALFHGVLAYGLAAFVTLSPITVSLALIPMKFNGLQVYFAGLTSTGLAIVFYSGASAVTAALFSTPGNHAFFIFVSGIVNPFLAVGIGVAGFAGLYLGAGVGLRQMNNLLS